MLSDFISSPFNKPLKIASKKHDVIALKINDKREKILPNIGLIPVQDSESEKIMYIDTSSKKIRDEYLENANKNVSNLKNIFTLSGVDLINIATDDNYVRPLINFFKNRERKK